MASEKKTSHVDQSKQKVGVQQNIVYYVSKHPLRFSLLLSAFVLAFVGFIAANFANRTINDKIDLSSKVAKDSAIGLEKFSSQIGKIVEAYVECEGVYGVGRFLYSVDLNTCQKRVVTELKRAEE